MPTKKTQTKQATKQTKKTNQKKAKPRQTNNHTHQNKKGSVISWSVQRR